MILTAEERNETRILTADGRRNTLTIPQREEAEADASVRRASGLIGEVVPCGAATAAIVPYSLSVRPINQRPPLVTMQPCRERENAVKFRRLYEDMTVFMGKKNLWITSLQTTCNLMGRFRTVTSHDVHENMRTTEAR